MGTKLETYPFLKIGSNTLHFSQFLHECVDDLIEKKPANYSNFNSDIQWTKEDFDKAKQSVQKLYRELVLKGKEQADLPDELSTDILQAINDCFRLRRDDIIQGLVKENLLNRGFKIVENLDWKLKWILGSSKLSLLREPLLQIDLNYCSKNSNFDAIQNNSVNFEVTLEQVNRLIDELSLIQKQLQ